MRIIFLILFLVICPKLGVAEEDFMMGRSKGWYYFEQQKKEKDPETEESETDPMLLLQTFQQQLELRKAAMIMQPSVENTRRYIEYQNMMMKKADIVSNNWQQAMMTYPHLNIVKDQPIAGAGLKILRHQEEDQNRILLEGFGKKFKLLFFYKKSCPYCLDFAGVLEFFSLKYGYKVASITLDGGQIKGFKSSYNPELTKKLKVEFTPAVFAYSEDDGIAVPVAHGYLSLDLFERNVLFVAKKLLGGRG